MQTIVIGHRNPDMDSICSAIAYAELKQKLGLSNVIAGRAGNTNERIDYVLQKFGVPAPEFVSDVAPKVAADQGYQNAKQNTPNTARLEHDRALQRVMVSLLKDDTELYKQFVQNESFRRFVTDMVFALTSA